MMGPKQIFGLALGLSYCIVIIHWADYELVPFQFKIYTQPVALRRNSSRPEGPSEPLGSASGPVRFQCYISAAG